MAIGWVGMEGILAFFSLRICINKLPLYNFVLIVSVFSLKKTDKNGVVKHIFGFVLCIKYLSQLTKLKA